MMATARDFNGFSGLLIISFSVINSVLFYIELLIFVSCYALLAAL